MEAASPLTRLPGELLLGAINDAPVSMAVFDREMRYLAVSRRFLVEHGVDPDGPVLGRSHYDVIPDLSARWRPLHQRALRGEALHADNDAVPYADGQVEPLRWTLRPWRTPEGEIGGLVLASERFLEKDPRVEELEASVRQLDETFERRVADQVAARLNAEGALRQSQKMEAIGQLTGGVAHDFNNLLTVIRSSAGLLKREDLPEERRRRYVDAIADTADRAAKLTGQLLAFARRQALKPEIFNVGERVDSIADMLRTLAGPGVELVAESDCPSCFAEADPSQFETALVNLAVNARDAMEAGGRITIRVHPADRVPKVRGHQAAEGRFVAVVVADTGVGIADEQMPQIFEPFFTTKPPGRGTGLGLSQVYGFAKQSGGEVDVASKLGQGTVFTLFLPRVAEQVRIADDTGSKADSPSQRGHILVVEDNEQVGSFSTEMLAELGFETSWAANADAALKMLETDAVRFDAVFSDVVMPGMSGIDLAREIRRRAPRLPVILTSGYSHALASEGTQGFELLQKPYSADEITDVLRRAICGRVGR
jgi:PAS domain S-box-containing protein